MLNTDVRAKLFAFGLNLLLALILVACNAVRVGTAPGTKVVELVNPSPAPWRSPAPTPTLSATSARTMCPPYSIDTALPVPDEPQSYIGLHFDILPDGLESFVSFVLGGPGTDYVVSEVVRDSGKMLWLERVICHDERGHAYKEIRAVLILPALQEKEKLITGTCKINGAATPEAATKPEFDIEIVAIGWFEDVHQPPVTMNYAWRANPQTETFEVLSPESVTCAGLRGE